MTTNVIPAAPGFELIEFKWPTTASAEYAISSDYRPKDCPETWNRGSWYRSPILAWQVAEYGSLVPITPCAKYVPSDIDLFDIVDPRGGVSMTSTVYE